MVTRTPTRSAMGTTWTETFGHVLWVNVLTLPVKVRLKYQTLYSNPSHRVAFAGKPNIDFALTEFQYGDIRLQPIAPALNPGPSNNWHTEVLCRDITDRRPSEGS
jgi:hypothetical protein